MTVPVLTAADGAAWEAALVAALARDGHVVRIARRCVDTVELLAVAATGQGRAALIASGLRRLDADTVDRLTAAHVVPIGVVARDDPGAEERLRAAGIVHLCAEDAPLAQVQALVRQAVCAPGPAPRTVAPKADETQRGAPTDGDRAQRSRGSVIAVWGPTGAPGRSTVAAGLADEVARLGRESLLVDADVYGGTLAPALGLLEESPGLAAACRLAGHTRLDTEALAQLCWQIRPGLRLLTGIPVPQRWPELRTAALDQVLANARALAEFTVVDCGFALESDEELSFDSLAPRRNGVTLAALAAADVVLAVAAADPIGVQRLVRGLAELRELGIGPVWVVVNKVRGGVVPGDPRRELTEALQRFGGCVPAAFLPYDRAALDAALASGRLLGESCPSSPLRRALGELAAAVTGAPASSPRRRR